MYTFFVVSLHLPYCLAKLVKLEQRENDAIGHFILTDMIPCWPAIYFHRKLRNMMFLKKQHWIYQQSQSLH